MSRALAVLLLTAAPAFAQKEFGFDNTKPSGQPYLTPEETVKRFKVAPEFEVKLFAGEPQVVNPIAFTIDEKGRVWVVESFEYPSRTPPGKAPRDRIVILEDTDGDGVCDKRTVFAEGKDFPVPEERKKAGLGAFDLASGIEVGHGGVFVGAPPYLWFIENKGDKPGKFETLLSGFGSQDTHEMLNTFQWGPDGWLYGCHGVFTQSTVKGAAGAPLTKMDAAVWRYHPRTKKFEIFAEGTSNPWGLDWRNTDGQFILACCVIPHLFHIVPGGVYKRQAGAFSNPYAYGQINEICDHTFHRESGWAHAGLISLDAPHIPEKYRDSVIFGSIHGCSLKRNVLKPNGSTYTASRADDFLQSGDKNVRPINLRWGPNGDIYLIDWHDQNPCHQAKPETWDYERGRVYRIQLKGTHPKKAQDIGNASSKELAAYLESANPYEFRTALRLTSERIAERHEIKNALSRPDGLILHRELKPLPAGLTKLCTTTHPEMTVRSALIDRAALARNWRMYCGTSELNGWRPPFDRRKVADAWALMIRLLADEAIVDSDVWEFLREEPGRRGVPVAARRELASAAIRLADELDVAELVHGLMEYQEDATDPVIPHLIWVAYEKLVARKLAKGDSLESEYEFLKKWAADNPLVRDQIIPRVVRRLAAAGRPADLVQCVTFVAGVKDVTAREKALGGLVTALAGQVVDAPAGWAELQAELRKEPRLVLLADKLAVSFRDPEAMKRANAIVHDLTRRGEERAEALRQMVLMRHIAAKGTTVNALVFGPENEILLTECARQLPAFDDPNLGAYFMEHWSKTQPFVRPTLVTSLASRKEWARDLLRGVKAGTVERTLVTDNTIIRMQAFKDAELNKLIETAWGRTRPTPKDLDALIVKMRGELASGPGSFVRGKAVFENQCAKCHKFDGKGADVGPQLDGAARDVEYILANVIDPNRVVGAPYFQRIAKTLDGRVEQGLLAEEDDRFVSLKVENGAVKKLAKADLDGPVQVVEKSMMPEGLTAGMTPQDFRDLVRYLMASPFLTAVTVNGTPTAAGVTGAVPLPAAAGPASVVAAVTAAGPVTTRLLVGSADPFTVALDGKVIGAGKGAAGRAEPDRESFDVTVPAGPHTVTITVNRKGTGGTLFARFLDPDRKLAYPEPAAKK